jgi:branched-chain amino acid aminotransferase
MHKFLSFNRKITLASEISLPALSSAAFYGRGIFTSLAIYDSKPFQWSAHWQRLSGNAEALGIDLSQFTEETVKNALAAILDRNKAERGRARVTFFDASAPAIWQNKSAPQTSLLITSADFRHVRDGFRLTVSPYPVNSKSPLVNVKSCNYLENLLTLEEASRRGFNEAIRLNEKTQVVAAAMANVFWISNEEIFTPALETGALEGTTRNFILDNFPVHEEKAPLGALESADELFLASSGIGIARVEALDKRKFKRTDAFIKIRAFFDEFVSRAS